MAATMAEVVESFINSDALGYFFVNSTLYRYLMKSFESDDVINVTPPVHATQKLMQLDVSVDSGACALKASAPSTAARVCQYVARRRWRRWTRIILCRRRLVLHLETIRSETASVKSAEELAIRDLGLLASEGVAGQVGTPEAFRASLLERCGAIKDKLEKSIAPFGTSKMATLVRQSVAKRSAEVEQTLLEADAAGRAVHVRRIAVRRRWLVSVRAVFARKVFVDLFKLVQQERAVATAAEEDAFGEIQKIGTVDAAALEAKLEEIALKLSSILSPLRVKVITRRTHEKFSARCSEERSARLMADKAKDKADKLEAEAKVKREAEARQKDSQVVKPAAAATQGSEPRRFKIDLTGSGFGICVCGHPKAAHSGREMFCPRADGEPEPDPKPTRQPLRSPSAKTSSILSTGSSTSGSMRTSRPGATSSASDAGGEGEASTEGGNDAVQPTRVGVVFQLSWRMKYGFAVSDSLVVEKINKGGQAESLGVQVGWQLVAIGESPMRNKTELKNAVSMGASIKTYTLYFVVRHT